jgi:putative aminopeptidase FrvX
MREASFEFLRSIVNTPRPPGHEARALRLWLDYVSPFADETHSDAYGNCVATLNKGGSPRIMIAGHMDEIAMTVNYINGDGYLHVRKMGGIDPAIMRGQRVVIHAKGGPILGVVGNVAPHLTKQDGDRKTPKMEDLFIDIGAPSKRGAQKLVQVGDPITLKSELETLRGDLVAGRSLDNGIGAFAAAESLRLLAQHRGKLKPEICAVANVMEEIGLLGARQIAYSLQPDAALVVDVTHATDYPSVSQVQHGEVEVGAGPTLTHGGCNHPVMVRRLEEIAVREKIRVQHETASPNTGTDTDVIFWTRGGIPSALISLPTRYMHSPAEVVSLTDLEAIPRLIAAFAGSVKRSERFSVKI